mgnify:FL=1
MERRLTRKKFNALVAEALDRLPVEFRENMRNVAVVVEDWPPDDLLDELGIPEDDTLFGSYQGTPLGERTHDLVQLPDRIVLYQRALEEECASEAELVREVAITVIHEIGHHFGLTDAEMDLLERQV